MTGDIVVHAGDCLDVMDGLPSSSIDAVVTDPPYNLSFMAKPWDSHEGHEDAGFAYWLSGLIDGEGCFTIKQHGRGTHAPSFGLKLRADERGTLEMIQRRLGIGSITDEPDHKPHPTSRWNVQDKTGCQRLVDLLDKYPLRAKKRIDYWAWRDAVCEWTDRPRGNRWHGQADNSRMAGLRTRLMASRAYSDVPWSGNNYQDWCRLWARECLRVVRPGGHLLAFGSPRTWHRLAAGIEDGGFDIRDTIMWLYGQGMPKIGTETGKPGWETALKPGWEPVIVARRPLDGPVVANMAEHGTGALHVDACRVPTSDSLGGGAEGGRTSHQPGWDRPGKHDPVAVAGVAARARAAVEHAEQTGRWPTNVVLSHLPDCEPAGVVEVPGDRRAGVVEPGRRPGGFGDVGASSGDRVPNGTLHGSQLVEVFDCAPGCVVAEVDRQSGARRGGSPIVAPPSASSTAGIYNPLGRVPFAGYFDGGGAARFYPVFRYQSKAGASERPVLDDGTGHPTVKPLDLMRWLVRLVTPEGGVVLDPFAGSGTTAEAAVAEGMRAILVEGDPRYAQLIAARLAKPIQPVMFGWPG